MSSRQDTSTKRAALPRLVCVWALLLALGTATADGRTKVSINAADRGVREVVSELAKQAGVTVRYLPGVGGLVSVRVNAVPFTEALTTVLSAVGYGWRAEGGVFVVGRFSAQPDDQTATTSTLPLRYADAATLARSFGWLDVSALGQAGSVLDLRLLLPPGLSGPPRPTADGKGLQVSGSTAAVADFRFLAQSFDRPPAAIAYRWLVAKASPILVDTLRVAWAQGPMAFGRSGEGREVLYSATDLEAQWERLSAAPEGLSILGRGTVTGRDLEVLQVASQGPGTPKLALAGRLEAGLALRLYAKCTIHVDGLPVEVIVDGGKLPPEEGALVVSRQKPGGAGPETVLMMIVPTVTVPEG
ncbi:MAG: hypothetical protein HZB16_03905 [Armatimonadetes bacterium]|nr:hypothetical protein [Armatimonadota bacterium]